MMFEDVQQLIKDASVAFPNYGNGVSVSGINEAQDRLNVAFPASYKWWLQNYGGGQIGGDVVYGLDESDSGRPDIVELALANEQQGMHGRERVVFAIGNEEIFFFDTADGLNECEEYSVYLEEYGEEPFLYANSFGDFLRRRIPEICEN